MKDRNENQDEIKELLNSTPKTNELLDELERISIPEYDNDPEFVASIAKGQIVEDILNAMAEQKLNKNKLAKQLNKSRQYVGKILNEEVNFTIDSLASIACALKYDLVIGISSRTELNELNSELFGTETYLHADAFEFSPPPIVVSDIESDKICSIADYFKRNREYSSVDMNKKPREVTSDEEKQFTA
jgi:transcriptional regulator with XRE-family HTH domain